MSTLPIDPDEPRGVRLLLSRLKQSLILSMFLDVVAFVPVAAAEDIVWGRVMGRAALAPRHMNPDQMTTLYFVIIAFCLNAIIIFRFLHKAEKFRRGGRHQRVKTAFMLVLVCLACSLSALSIKCFLGLEA